MVSQVSYSLVVTLVSPDKVVLFEKFKFLSFFLYFN